MTWWSLRRSRPDIKDVFTPGGVPSVTYVGRDDLGLEDRLSQALSRKHAFIVVSGPTKCGKSVLCQRVLGHSPTIVVEGGQFNTAEEFWQQIAHRLRLASSLTNTRTRTWSWRGLLEATVGVPAFLQKKVSTDATAGGQLADAVTFRNVFILDAIEELQREGTTLVIEDFHYASKPTQRAIIRSLKSAVFAGLKVVILAVPHRAFDPTDVEAEVEGRVHHVAIPRWSVDDLLKIVDQGFAALGMRIPTNIRRRICEDAFGNPLVVQEICYEISELRRDLPSDAPPMNSDDLARVYDQLLDRKGLRRFDRLANSSKDDAGSRLVELRAGGEEVMGIVLLSAIARLGPSTVTNYSDIRESFATLSRARPPSQAQIAAIFSAMAKALSENGAAPFEWLPGRQELALTDPFLMFYMRWVLRDRRRLKLGQSALDTSVRVLPGSATHDQDSSK